MSWHQSIHLHDWNISHEDHKPVHISSPQNDHEHMQQSLYVSDSITAAQQSNYTSFDHNFGPGQMSTSSAPGTTQDHENMFNYAGNTTWPSRLNVPRSDHDHPKPTVPIPPAKHRSLKTETKHAQGSLSSIRRRGKRKADQSRSFICEWAGCDRSDPFACKATLMRHVETQHVAPHSIPCLDGACDQFFSRKDNMVMHYRSVHRDDVLRGENVLSQEFP